MPVYVRACMCGIVLMSSVGMWLTASVFHSNKNCTRSVEPIAIMAIYSTLTPINTPGWIK